MTDLSFAVAEPRAERFAAVPTLAFPLRITAAGGARIQSMMLRCQVRIEPRRRAYSADEQARLGDLFGEPARWGDTVRSFLWTHAVLMVPGFEGSVEIGLPVACTYDLEVTASKYFHSLDGGEVPLLLLFSGTIFLSTADGLRIEQVPWSKEAQCRFPARVWRELMDAYFPGCGWIRLRRENLDALRLFKSRRALMTWDETIRTLIETASQGEAR